MPKKNPVFKTYYVLKCRNCDATHDVFEEFRCLGKAVIKPKPKRKAKKKKKLTQRM
jgi:hypothetical protein